MRILSVDIPKDKLVNGLDPIKMDKLGQVVLLAGKNGAGKSRVLSSISSELINNKPTLSTYSNYLNRANQLKSQYTLTASRVKRADRVSSVFQSVAKLTNINNKNIAEEERLIGRHIKDIEGYNNIVCDALYDSYSVIRFVPKELQLQQVSKLSKDEILKYAKSMDSLGIYSVAKGTYPRIQLIQDRWFNATHQDSVIDIEIKKETVEDYTRLRELVKVFLNSDINRNIEGEATLFNTSLDNLNLSDGQKILLQFCLAIHCQQKSLDELILFMDEPENHLHPSIIIDIIERIRGKTTNGQIWIATHSVPILSYFDPSCIWWVDDNRVSYAGNVPEKVLKGLLGDEERIEKLKDFISLPGIMALNRHAYESLFHPEAVVTGKDDPQGLQIREEIQKYLSDSSKIRILDYGAGKGRLLANILENNQLTVTQLRQQIDYIAFDKFPNDKIDCIATIERLYEDADKRYYNEFGTLLATYDKGSFDVVVMCNVLHEVDPKEWIRLFKDEIAPLLSDKGVVLLVEDQEMPIGEKAYQKGFIVLDTQDLKQLFSIKEADKHFPPPNEALLGRLKAHSIPKDLLLRITPESRVETLKSIHQNAASKVLDIRTKEINYKNGKKHGFWLQQLANTTLALQELSS